MLTSEETKLVFEILSGNTKNWVEVEMFASVVFASAVLVQNRNKCQMKGKKASSNI